MSTGKKTAIIFLLCLSVLACARDDSLTAPAADTENSSTAAVTEVQKDLDEVPGSLAASMELSYAEQVDQAAAGSNVRYVISMRNTSDQALTNLAASAMTVKYDWLDDPFTKVISSGEAPAGLAGVIAAGETKQIGFEVTAPTVPGQYVLKVYVEQKSGVSLLENGLRPLHYRVVIN